MAKNPFEFHFMKLTSCGITYKNVAIRLWSQLKYSFFEGNKTLELIIFHLVLTLLQTFEAFSDNLDFNEKVMGAEQNIAGYKYV